MTQANLEKFNQAFSLHNEGKLSNAKDLYMEILNDEPENSEVWDLLGVLHFQTKDFLEAELCIKKAIKIKPEVYYFENLAKIYLEKGDFPLAISFYEELTQSFPHNYEYWFNLALAYKNNQEFEKSKQAYYKVLELNPNSAETYFNLAYFCFNENNPQGAIDCYKKTLELNPKDFEAQYFLGLAYMQVKNYKEGLKYYEARLCKRSSIVSQLKTYPNLMKEKPIWRGENLKDKVLYTYYEAGFGDSLMFFRYVPQLAKMCKKLIIKPQKELAPLFRENSYGAEIMEMYDLEKDVYFDYHIPFLSIPFVLGLCSEEDIFVHHDRYLKANPPKINYYKERYFNNDKFKIGIKWQGNTFYDKERVLKVEDFFKLFDLPNTQFYSFQTFDGAEEFEKIKSKYDVIDLGKTFSNFSDTAGAVENLDLVICNDTSLAHLAGAMNKPCWVLLPYIYNWRWHEDLTHCDWYDSVKLFRQSNHNDWSDVFESVEIELKKILENV